MSTNDYIPPSCQNNNTRLYAPKKECMTQDPNFMHRRELQVDRVCRDFHLIPAYCNKLRNIPLETNLQYNGYIMRNNTYCVPDKRNEPAPYDIAHHQLIPQESKCKEEFRIFLNNTRFRKLQKPTNFSLNRFENEQCFSKKRF